MAKDKIETTAAPKPEEIRSLQGIEALKPQAPEVEVLNEEVVPKPAPDSAAPIVPSESE